MVRELPLDRGRRSLSVSGTLALDAGGWCLLRAFSARAEYPILDNFVYATTSPIYVSVRGQARRSSADARFFEAWIDHLLATTAAYPDWNSDEEKTQVLQTLRQARAVYERLE